jgi:ribosomal protein L19E
MITPAQRIRNALTRDEVVRILDEQGIKVAPHFGLMMREARKNQDWKKLDLLAVASTKLKVLTR